MSQPVFSRCDHRGVSVGTLVAETRCAQVADLWKPLASLGTALSLPDTAYLELTSVCNNRCVGCANVGFIATVDDRSKARRGQNRPLDAARWGRILKNLQPTMKRVNLTGGEPTLHPEFPAIVTAIAKRGIDLSIFTNGRWPEPEPLLDLLAGQPTFHGFLISLHGARAVSHDAFTGVPGSFNETVANIKRAVRRGLAVTTSTIITHWNARELDEIAAFSRQLGARAATFNRYLVFAPGSEPSSDGGDEALFDIVPSRRELRAAMGVIEALRRKNSPLHGIDYGPCIPQCFTSSGSRGCSAGTHSLAVDPWGNVKPCTDTTLFCGNLLEETLDDIWSSDQMQRWRALVPPTCAGCVAYPQCRAGCRALALASELGRDPLMTRELVRA